MLTLVASHPVRSWPARSFATIVSKLLGGVAKDPMSEKQIISIELWLSDICVGVDVLLESSVHSCLSVLNSEQNPFRPVCADMQPSSHLKAISNNT